jgi:hypothetical protein
MLTLRPGAVVLAGWVICSVTSSESGAIQVTAFEPTIEQSVTPNT